MINLSSINLSQSEIDQINTNLIGTASSGIEMIAVPQPINPLWFSKITIYEFWLLRYISEDEFTTIEHLIHPATLDAISNTWTFDDATMTVIAGKNYSLNTAFPTLSVVANNFGKPLNLVYIDPLWISDTAVAWYAKYCETGQWTQTVPYLPTQVIQDIKDYDQHYQITCATSEVTGDLDNGPLWDPSMNTFLTNTGLPELTYHKIVSDAPQQLQTSGGGGTTVIYNQYQTIDNQTTTTNQTTIDNQTANNLSQTTNNQTQNNNLSQTTNNQTQNNNLSQTTNNQTQNNNLSQTTNNQTQNINLTQNNLDQNITQDSTQVYNIDENNNLQTILTSKPQIQTGPNRDWKFHALMPWILCLVVLLLVGIILSVPQSPSKPEPVKPKV